MTTSILQRSRAVVAVLATVLLCASCTSTPPLPGDLKVGEITTGRMIGPDGQITEESRTTLFWTTDTFYASVATDGSAQNVPITARWSGPDGKVAAEVTKTISPSGSTTTTFEAPPKDGRWAAGDYKVDVLVNGGSQGSKDINAR
ncbi:MAG: hypothetical protein ABIR79_09070 [Candidatus Binatia bacterium]